MALPITLTESAHKHMLSVVAQKGVAGVRLSVSKSGCSGLKYVTDFFKEPKADDALFEQAGLHIAIAQDSIQYLQGMVLDYQAIGPGQTQLVYHNPNATDACGCGESFRYIDHHDGASS